MKKVRFETPTKVLSSGMDEQECHSPRPFMEMITKSQKPNVPLDHGQYQRMLPYSSDPIQRFENSDSSPYPMLNKTKLSSISDQRNPSHDLDLSMLDSSNSEPRKFVCKPMFLKQPDSKIETVNERPTVLSSIENVTPPNVLSRDNNFFIRRDNLDMYRLDTNPFPSQFNRLTLDKENDPLSRKVEIMTRGAQKPASPNPDKTNIQPQPPQDIVIKSDCSCHHCIRAVQVHSPQDLVHHNTTEFQKTFQNSNIIKGCNQCHYVPPQPPYCYHCAQTDLNCHTKCKDGHIESKHGPPVPQNAVDKKTWAIEKYEKSTRSGCMEVERQTNITKEKREPTVADLFKIIKLQNEQLQLLQDKVDKFISASNNGAQNVQSIPVQSYMREHVALQTIQNDSEDHKISIGVMTSFEMVRTSTVINKGIVKQTNENAQIQCNRSQISIKEVVSKSKPVSLNFLDGIMPVEKAVPSNTQSSSNGTVETVLTGDNGFQSENVNEEKTLNELSLYNVQVDNATTPFMSPEQSLYLDIRDYSDSESGSDDQSNVGWTYYNKVMTHVNGMLQDSDMPSSASALYRNTRQQCVQMQTDKTNVSVTKRVKFGDDPHGIQQPHIHASDTSLKMNQLAAKYLNSPPAISRPVANTGPGDMSFATRNYMEKHKLLQGTPTTLRSPPPSDMPRFLDITALKKQSKLL